MSDPDELVRRIRAGLSAEVAGWSPEGRAPARVPRPVRRRGVALAVGLATVLVIGGGVAGALALSESSPAPSIRVGGPAPVSPTVTLVPSPTQVVDQLGVAGECSAADLVVSLVTDRASYGQLAPVTITATARVLHTCQVVTGSPTIAVHDHDGILVERTGLCPQHDGAAPVTHCVAGGEGVDTWHVGETHTDVDVWNQRGPRFAAQPDTYTVGVSVGVARGRTTFAVTAAPTCTELVPSLTTDKASYRLGETAHITGSVRNTGGAPCDLSYGQTFALASRDGEVVWQGCKPTGVPKTSPCGTNLALIVGADPLLPGQSAAILSSTWALAHDGTATATPGPVTPGSYTLTWDSQHGTVTTTVAVVGH